MKQKIRMIGTALLGAALILTAFCLNEAPVAAAQPVLVPTGTEVPAGSRGGLMQIAFVRGNKRTQLTVNGGVTATVNGVTLSSLAVNGAGAVRALVSADCRARDAHFTLRAEDSRFAPAVATLRIAVLPNSPPALSYDTTQFVAPGGALMIKPGYGPSDQGGIARVFLRRVFPRFGGELSVNEQGIVTLNRAPLRGSFQVTVRAVDDCGAFKDASFTVKVGGGNGGGNNNECPILGVNPSSLPPGFSGTYYHQQLMAGGGAKPIEFTVAGGKLPQGLKLLPIGLLMGKPRKAGQYDFSIRATDARGCWGSGAYTLTIRDRRDDLALTELVKTEPAKAEPVKAEAAKTEPEPKPAEAAPEKAGKKSKKAKPDEKAEPAKAEPVKAEPEPKPTEAAPEKAAKKSKKAKPDEAASDSVKPKKEKKGNAAEEKVVEKKSP
jgi:hypothetical protein